ncbi:MAG: bifunctional nuclease family protein [Myxococcota bacterium]
MRSRNPLSALTALAAALVLIACSSPAGPEPTARAMRVTGVRLDPRTSSPVILLQEEKGAHRQLPIWIGVNEARSIALALEKIVSPRPNSHDLIRNLVLGIDAVVSRVLITELRDGTFYAVLEVEIDGRRVGVDSRPSDAIAVAVRTGTPVFATEEVLDEAGLVPGGGEGLEIDWRGPPLPRAAEPARTH